MGTIAADERVALRDAVTRLLADKCTQADVRRTMDTPEGYDRALWRLLAEMGVVGLLAPEEFGGAGLGPVEMEMVMEEAGAALLCAPLLSSAVLAVSALTAAGDRDAQTRLLPTIAAGETVATLALTGDAGAWTPEAVDVRAARAGNAWVLNGVASFVTHGQIADVILVVARAEEGLSLFEIAGPAREGATGGLAVRPLPTFDHTLRLARLEFSAAPARLIGIAGKGWDAAARALEVARVALAGNSAGGGRRILEMTVDYAKSRIQFGRQIGSFQAIKHMAADLLLESESAISAARAAAQALSDGAPDAPAAIALASFACADAYTTIAATSIQMHGGIAFTWEHPAHLYLRRARADAQLFGGSNAHRETFVQLLGG